MWAAQSGCGHLFASAAIRKGDGYRTPDRGRGGAIQCAIPTPIDSRKCQTLGVHRQSRRFTHDYSGTLPVDLWGRRDRYCPNPKCFELLRTLSCYRLSGFLFRG